MICNHGKPAPRTPSTTSTLPYKMSITHSVGNPTEKGLTIIRALLTHVSTFSASKPRVKGSSCQGTTNSRNPSVDVNCKVIHFKTGDSARATRKIMCPLDFEFANPHDASCHTINKTVSCNNVISCKYEYYWTTLYSQAACMCRTEYIIRSTIILLVCFTYLLRPISLNVLGC